MKLARPLHELPNPTPRGLRLALLDFGQMVFLHQAQGFAEVARVGKLGRTKKSVEEVLKNCMHVSSHG